MDRICAPSGVITRTRPSAGVIEDIEREDDRRGYEPEPEGVLRVVIPATLTADSSGWSTWR